MDLVEGEGGYDHLQIGDKSGPDQMMLLFPKASLALLLSGCSVTVNLPRWEYFKSQMITTLNIIFTQKKLFQLVHV